MQTENANETYSVVFWSARTSAALNLTSSDDKFVPQLGGRMRTTLALDDELVAKAQALTGLNEKSGLVREALKALIERESARRLARLGGSEPELTTSPPAAGEA
jgi:Arc/MetJ family transcription regulator